MVTPEPLPPTVDRSQAHTSGGTVALEKGEAIFKREMCVGCHAGGNNDLMPNKPIKGKAFAAEYGDDAKLEATIRAGFPDSGMPQFPAQRINKQEMKDLILYIRSFTAEQ